MVGHHVLVVLVACVGVYGLDWSGHEGSVPVPGVDQLAVEAMMSRRPFQHPRHRISSDGFEAEEESPLAMYLPVHAPADSSCGAAVADVTLALSSPTNATIYATKMVDSWGKVPDGFLYGASFYAGIGVFDECVRLKSPDSALTGRFCSIMYSVSSEQNSTRFNEIKPRLGPVSAITNIAPLIGAAIYGTCIPSTCTQDDMKESILETLNNTNRELIFIDCEALADQPQFSAADIAMITFLAVMLMLLVLASGVDVYCRIAAPKRPHPAFRYLLPFSAYTNLEKLFQISTERRPGVISCLHGMRVLSMTWVIYGHQYMFNALDAGNFQHLGKRTSGLLFQIISNATVSTDSFFFLSGLLVAYLFLKEVKKTGKFNVVLFYVHRIIRLTPPIAFVALFVATLFKYLLSGPKKFNGLYTANACEKYWWRDVLYVDNLVTEDYDTGQATDCLGQCWYTAADTQMYLVAPLLLLPLAFYPTKGRIWLFLMTLVSVVIPATIIYVYDYPPLYIFLTLDPNVDVEGYGVNVYLPPWCRIAAYIVGIWTGYILFKNTKLKLSPWQVVAGWSVATFSGLAVLLGGWGYNRLIDGVPYDPVTQVLYGGLHRAVWCAALAWVVLACHYGYGGPVNEFLSHPTWQPLSRLTYSMYLVAIPVQTYTISNAQDMVYFTHYNKIIETCGAVFLSIMVAIPVTLTVEAPVLGLEKILLARTGHSVASAPAPNNQAGGQTNPAFSDEGNEVKEVLEEEMKKLGPHTNEEARGGAEMSKV